VFFSRGLFTRCLSSILVNLLPSALRDRWIFLRSQVFVDFDAHVACSLVFDQAGVAFCRELSRSSGRLGLASCRLLDNRQLRLGKAMKGEQVRVGGRSVSSSVLPVDDVRGLDAA